MERDPLSQRWVLKLVLMVLGVLIQGSCAGDCFSELKFSSELGGGGGKTCALLLIEKLPFLADSFRAHNIAFTEGFLLHGVCTCCSLNR